MKREWPWLVLAVALLVVLLHANAPEVWFWFGALLVLLLWRSNACRQRWRETAAQEEGSSAMGSTTGEPG
ncbi:MAG: hypothetical protein VKM68_05420 [Cyanobacteriota bacterium]|nr:hypothetical protein [Cyanobacteriota bacterium]